MPYNPETEEFYQATATIVDSTPDGDTVLEGFDDRLTPAMAGVYTDLNLLKENGMIGVGIPATTTSRGIGRVATLADMEPDAVVENGPAFLAAGDVVSVIEERRFVVGEFYYFRHPTIKPGFAPLQGGLISGVYQGKNITEWPIWEYLQTADGQLLLKTEAEWQAMTTAIWHTNADETTVGWDGIGGAPYYVQDLGAGTLRMPDVRGMHIEAAGFDSLGVGGVQGDTMRRIYGAAGFSTPSTWSYRNLRGAITSVADGYGNVIPDYNAGGGQTSFVVDSERVAPTSNATKPRAWGALACAYLGQPA